MSEEYSYQGGAILHQWGSLCYACDLFVISLHSWQLIIYEFLSGVPYVMRVIYL